MIKKLIKYDVKNMTKILWIMYTISLGIAIIARLFDLGSRIQIIDVITKICQGATYSAIANILINTYIHILRVFITNFYKDESYLTHTLPVNKQQLVLSKYISSILVILASVLVSIASLLILFYDKNFFQNIENLLSAILYDFKLPVPLILIGIIALIAVEVCTVMGMAFCAIIKAHTYNSQRIIKGIFWFIVYYFGAQTILAWIFVFAFLVSGNFTELLAEKLSSSSFILLTVISIIFYSVMTIVYYFFSLKLFQKGVNVD